MVCSDIKYKYKTQNYNIHDLLINKMHNTFWVTVYEVLAFEA